MRCSHTKSIESLHGKISSSSKVVRLGQRSRNESCVANGEYTIIYDYAHRLRGLERSGNPRLEAWLR